MTYLGQQASDGEPIFLRIGGLIVPHVCPGVVKEIQDRVREFDRKATMATERAPGRCEGREVSRRQMIQELWRSEVGNDVGYSDPRGRKETKHK